MSGRPERSERLWIESSSRAENDQSDALASETEVGCRFQQPSEERHAGVGDGGVVLIRDAAVVADDLSFFSLDQSQQAIDG